MRSASSSPNDFFRIEADPSEIKLAQQGSVNLILKVENRIEKPLRIALSSGGLPPGWGVFSHSQVVLRAGGYQYVSVAIAPQHDQRWLAGTRSMQIMARLVGNSAERTAISVPVTFPLVQQFASRLSPQEIEQGESAEIAIDNHGNRTELYRVRVHTEDAEVDTPLPHTATVAAGTSVIIPIVVSHNSPHLIGPNQIYPFVVRIENDGRAEISQGSLIVRPRVPPFVQVVVAAIVLVLGVWLLSPHMMLKLGLLISTVEASNITLAPIQPAFALACSVGLGRLLPY